MPSSTEPPLLEDRQEALEDGETRMRMRMTDDGDGDKYEEDDSRASLTNDPVEQEERSIASRKLGDYSGRLYSNPSSLAPKAGPN